MNKLNFIIRCEVQGVPIMSLRACYRNLAGLDYFSPYVGHTHPHILRNLKLIVDRI